MELLLPAGNFESVKAAVQNGADAVYFGGQKFNARRNASNFDDGLLEDAVNYCRLRNVKTHITLNTLLFDKELNDAFAFAKKLYEIGADAVIVQDIGLIRILRDKLPELTIHASTQLGVHNIEGAALMREMGVKRVVLAREMRLCEIKKIHENVDIELEAFAHGAMCVSFSGQCLFSSMVGARSGNRGKCAQPCRKCIEADAKDNKEIKAYDLSLADMCMIEHLDKMKEAGISCIKIEGRMKRSEYVAAAARAYRAAIDGADTTLIAAHKRTLETVFERGGFSTANYFENDRKTGCIATSNADDALYNELKKTYESDKRLINASFELELYKFEYPRLKMSLPQNAVEVEAVGSNLVQKAEKPQNVERLKAQIGKLGGTVFVCSDCSVCMDDDAFISAGELNELRRNACKMMEDRLLEKKKSGMGMSSDSLPKVRAFSADKNMLIQAMVSNANQARHAFEAGADEVVLYPHDYESAINELEKLQKYRDNKKLLLNLPHVVLSSDDAETIKCVLKSGLTDGAVANNIGQIEWIKEQKLKYAGIGLNAFNMQAVSKLYDMGFDKVTLSLELTKPQMRDIIKNTGGSVWVYGRAPLMQLTHCVLKERGKCKKCAGDAGTMTDAEGRVFKLRNIRMKNDCSIILLNCDITDIRDLYKELPTPDSIILSFSDERGEDVERIIKETLSGNINKPQNLTRGHYNRAVD